MKKIFKIISHPLPTLFLFLYGDEKKYEILEKYPDVFYQFYRSNRLRGFCIKESVKRAVLGYGCYKGFKAEEVDEVSFWNRII